MMLAPEGPSALPLWLNGHAFLTVSDRFYDICSPSTGQALRRLPACGPDEVSLAIHAAQHSASVWLETPPEKRLHVLQTTAELLEKYAAHLSKLLIEETGISAEQAAQELLSAASALKRPATSPSQGIQVITYDATAPFAGPAAHIAAALAAGLCVIVKTSIKAPGTLFALAELLTRSELPAGVIGILHGEEETLTALAAAQELNAFVFVGSSALHSKIAEILATHQKTLSPTA